MQHVPLIKAKFRSTVFDLRPHLPERTQLLLNLTGWSR